MPFSHYLPEQMGSITAVARPARFVAGSLAGADAGLHRGHVRHRRHRAWLKVSWRTTSDMAKPQFDKPQAPNFTTVEASNGAEARGLVRPAPTSGPMRTRCSSASAAAICARATRSPCASATGARARRAVACRPTSRSSVELATLGRRLRHLRILRAAEQPAFDLVARRGGDVEGDPAVARRSPANRSVWRLSPRTCGAIRATRSNGTRRLEASLPVRGLAGRRTAQARRRPARDRIEISSPTSRAIVGLSRLMARRSERRARQSAARGASKPPLRRYWGDLHGQSGENHRHGLGGRLFPLRARCSPSSTWSATRATTSRSPMRSGKSSNRAHCRIRQARHVSSACPATNGRATPAWAATATVFYRREGRPIRRSSHVLVEGQTSTDAIYTADKLFEALQGRGLPWSIAHVGGRYADHELCRMTAGSSARSRCTRPGARSNGCCTMRFEQGYRVGVVCHSDDHKGRPGATRPGASTLRRDRRADLLFHARS